MSDRFFRDFERWLLRIEQARGFPVLFATLAFLLVLQMWPAAWSGNEEHYFQLAYWTFAPERFSPYHPVALDHSLARFIPLYLMGSVIGWLGYDAAHTLWRMLMALLYASGLAYFLSALRLSPWDALLAMILFLSNEQLLIGGEWLFRSVETKTLAYAALFFAFGLALRRRWTGAAILAAVATYMHFLVGGFWVLVILFVEWLETREWRSVLRSGVVYTALVLPQVGLVVWDQIAGAVTPAALADGIYAERVRSHVAPFTSRRQFWGWSWGIAPWLALSLVLATIWVRHRPAAATAAAVLRWALSGLTYLLFALVAAYLDRHTQVLAKLYVFRPAALTLLLGFTAIVALIRELLPERAAALKALLVLGLLATSSWRTFHIQVDRFHAARETIPATRELVSAIAAHTAPGDVVLLDPVGEFELDRLRLHRVLGRPTLVAEKFVPTNPADVLRWDAYLRQRRRLFASGCSGATTPIRWLLSFRPAAAARLVNCGPAVWRRGDTVLIRVDPQQ